MGSYNDKKIRCENLENLTFSDNTFDIFITQDVFEHIFDPITASKEIMRVLKPGGSHVFTTTKHKNSKNFMQRASKNGTTLEY